MATRKTAKVRRPANRPDQNLKAIYARVKRAFSAADLQRYTETEHGIPAEKVLADMKRIHRKASKR